MSFASFGLSDALVRAVADVGYTEPTPIQKQAIPVVLAGGDLLAGAQTGTGKTAAFVLPILHRLAQAASGTAVPPERSAGNRSRHAATKIRSLILTPTRELAAQVAESVHTYGKHTTLSSTVVFGGVAINPQIERLRRGVDILVATPGRLLDHHGQRTVDLSGVEILVLDEADRMLDMGFIHDIKRILAILPRQRQNLLFSATFADPIRDLANGLLKAPEHIQVTPRNSTVDSVEQTAHPVDAAHKADLLVHLVKGGNWFQVLVFTRTKHGANKLATRLEKSGVPALAIHGNKSQGARTRALAEFKSGKLQVLVATDIAARGLDIEQLPHVVNFEMPHVPEDYVHRIGRTGRAGATGEAVSLVSPEELGRLRDIERLIKRPIKRVAVADFEPSRVPVSTADGDRQEQRPSSRPSRSRPGQAPAGRRDAKPKGRDTKPPRRDAQPPHRPSGEGGRAPAPESATRKPRAPTPAQPAHRGVPAGQHAEPRRGTGRPDRGRETSSLVRSNLPPGWTVPAPARRGR
ncbi:MAG TPA: DEAD/DEAH box helicase [Burkholderiaceae bacterium]